jgi:hypothetical protein
MASVRSRSEPRLLGFQTKQHHQTDASPETPGQGFTVTSTWAVVQQH